MLRIGLTGSIAMGKSETARMFRRLGFPVFDADAAVHRLYARGGKAVDAVGREFPSAVEEGSVDRAELSRIAAADPSALLRIEKLVHPLVREEEEAFLAASRDASHLAVVLDIPLLYESRREKDLDAVVVVSAPAAVQRTRALARRGMTEAKLDAILVRQVSDSAKRRRADFIVETGRGPEDAFEQVRAIADQLTRWAREAKG